LIASNTVIGKLLIGSHPAEDLGVQKEMWLEKLTASGYSFYGWSAPGT